MKIITDHKFNKPILSYYELKKKDQEWFKDLFTGYDEASYFYYRGSCYTLGDFMRIDENNPLKVLNYDGYHSDSFFSGIVIKFSECNELLKCATYIS